jgi:hypothetical protein
MDREVQGGMSIFKQDKSCGFTVIIKSVLLH